jgi:hypothetical protein
MNTKFIDNKISILNNRLNELLEEEFERIDRLCQLPKDIIHFILLSINTIKKEYNTK